MKLQCSEGELQKVHLKFKVATVPTLSSHVHLPVCMCFYKLCMQFYLCQPVVLHYERCPEVFLSCLCYLITESLISSPPRPPHRFCFNGTSMKSSTRNPKYCAIFHNNKDRMGFITQNCKLKFKDHCFIMLITELNWTEQNGLSA